MKYILLFLCYNFAILSTYCYKYIPILKKALIYDKNMPTLYVSNVKINTDIIKKNVYSLEHIVPKSFLNKEAQYDMHNIVRTFNYINNCRSNYKFVDIKDSKYWIELDFNNHVNHKQKQFIPNSNSKGIISRAILYMAITYDYNISSTIDKELLKNWYFKYPPKKSEIEHNMLIRTYQRNNNAFISEYKSKFIKDLVRDL